MTFTRTRPVRFRAIRSRGGTLLASLLVLGLASCAAPPTAVPVSATIAADEYARAFDAAVEALRDVGFVTAVRDRAGGVIETEPLRIGGLMEPWVLAAQPWSLSAESTLSLQRRRARVEFMPESPTAHDGESDAVPMEGPDMIGAASSDLRRVDGPMRMRVWVAIERAHTPGIRRFAWTRSVTTRTIDPAQPIDPADGVLATSIWTPVGRDHDAERRVAQGIDRRIAASRDAQESMRGSANR